MNRQTSGASTGGGLLGALPKQTQTAILAVAVIVIVTIVGFFLWPKNTDPAHLSDKVRHAKKSGDK